MKEIATRTGKKKSKSGGAPPLPTGKTCRVPLLRDEIDGDDDMLKTK